MEILLATNNQGKVIEMKRLMEDLGIKVFSLKDKNIEVEVVEDGQTFEQNSYKKASELAKISGMVTVADDSGLEVEYLNNAPGVYSARYAGENATDKDKYTKLLKELDGVQNRKARFVCVATVVYPDGKSYSFRGECEGVITTEAHGDGGFGYDPVFFVPEFNKTFGEIPLSEKNKISHRGKAFRMLKEHFKNN